MANRPSGKIAKALRLMVLVVLVAGPVVLFAEENDASPSVKASLSKTESGLNGFITSTTPTILVSVNDGEAGTLVTGRGVPVQDSVSVIKLTPNSPPEIKTVYGIAHSSLIGSPHTAVLERFGIVTNHNIRLDNQRKFVPMSGPHVGRNQVVIVDLESMTATDQMNLDSVPWLAHAHPDRRRVIIALATGWLVAQIGTQGNFERLTKSVYEHPITSFDLSPDGNQILAVVGSPSTTQWLAKFVLSDDDSIRFDARTDPQKYHVEGPFSPRIYPDGKKALVLNSAGLSDGISDDVMIVDMEGNKVVARVPQVSDGLESIAIHPSGQFAVISCLNAMPWTTTSHLAVIDLQNAPRLLYTLPVEPIPEGIEFSKGGNQLFVGSTLANHISVYRVENKRLILQPYVLAIGDGHSALGISFTASK